MFVIKEHDEIINEPGMKLDIDKFLEDSPSLRLAEMHNMLFPGFNLESETNTATSLAIKKGMAFENAKTCIDIHADIDDQYCSMLDLHEDRPMRRELESAKAPLRRFFSGSEFRQINDLSPNDKRSTLLVIGITDGRDLSGGQKEFESVEKLLSSAQNWAINNQDNDLLNAAIIAERELAHQVNDHIRENSIDHNLGPKSPIREKDLIQNHLGGYNMVATAKKLDMDYEDAVFNALFHTNAPADKLPSSNATRPGVSLVNNKQNTETLLPFVDTMPIKNSFKIQARKILKDESANKWTTFGLSLMEQFSIHARNECNKMRSSGNVSLEDISPKERCINALDFEMRIAIAENAKQEKVMNADKVIQPEQTR